MTTLGADDIVIPSITATVFPNPLTNNSVLVLNNEKENKSGDFHFLIYDITGRIMNDEIIHFIPGTNTYEFRREGLADGIYTFQIKNETKTLSSGKVIVN